MSTNFLHGPRTLEYDDGTKEISTVDVSVIGVVGTAPDASIAARSFLLWGSELADNLVEFSTVMPGADGNNWIVEIVNVGINGSVATPGYSTLPDGSRKLTLTTDGATTPSKLADQNQQYKEGLPLGESINVTFGGDHAGTGTVFALPPTNLSGGKDESFPCNIPTVIAGSKKNLSCSGGTVPSRLLYLKY